MHKPGVELVNKNTLISHLLTSLHYNSERDFLEEIFS